MERKPRIEPMIYEHQGLMDELNEFSVTLKVWLFPEAFGDKLADIQRRYPKPDIQDIDKLQAKLNAVLRTHAKRMQQY